MRISDWSSDVCSSGLPVLASLGGGGFLLAQPAGREPLLYDFFVQTPRRRGDPAQLDFHPILADFGTATQEFHIGIGAVAEIGSASCRARVCQYGSISVAAVTLKKNTLN